MNEQERQNTRKNTANMQKFVKYPEKKGITVRN
jgi:hypothetical protein